MANLHLLTQHKLYPQNGERIVTIDSVTSFHRMYTRMHDAETEKIVLDID